MATHRAPTAGDSGADPDGGPAENATATASPEPRAGSANYKRASRKGAPRRFTCSYPGCDKVYSRAEHLQRHQLNREPRAPLFEAHTDPSVDNPKEIYQCDVPGCEQKFVRLDLLTRHKKRHSSSYIPRNRVPNFNAAVVSGNQSASPAVTSPTGLPTPSPSIHQPPHPHQPLHSPPQHQHHHAYPHVPRGPYNSSVLLTPSSNPSPQQPTLPHPGPSRLPHGNGWAPPPLNDMGMNMLHPKQNYYSRDTAPLPGPTSLMAYSGATPDQLLARDNFAMWLFDPQTTFSDFGVASIPFLEGGLESAFNNDIRYDYESLASRSQPEPTPPRQTEGADDLLGEPRRQEILRVFQLFRKKTDRYEPAIADIARESGGDLPALNLEMMRDCVHEYWESVSPRLPIIHQPTFSANRCPILLLVVMVALGAASLRSRDGGGSLRDYGAFADVLIEGARWEIFMAEESTPPVALWAAQALLLLEFYEKLYSSRRFHERAHIYHTAILNNLRRGSPLIGRAGSESPPEEAAPTTAPDDQPPPSGALDSRAWWVRWAESESMHRVVFVAFMLDIIHGGMFGHAVDMAPHEIRLPLPCDDNLWSAPTPDSCRQLDGSLRMYGVKQVSFLDGLKSALHGKEVKTHSFARMIIMSGLLSVAWHLSHRETHLRWLDSRGGPDAQDGWRRMIFRAFDVWKTSFDAANGDADPRGAATGPILSAGVLYHLAHICLHVDIVDCQVYAGARRLLGRKVSTRDYTNAAGRMRAWAKQPTARYAVLHAFKLLHRVLVGLRGKGDGGFEAPYAIRNDPDPHRPWIMYYAALSIWSLVRALNPSPPPVPAACPRGAADQGETYRRAVAYLARGASLGELGEEAAAGLYDGLPDLLDVMCGILEGANSELLREALERFRGCRDMLMGVGS